METQRTPARQTIALRIADDLRIKIELGELRAGDSLPPLHQLMEEYDASQTSARNAITLLKQQGLVVVKRGTPPKVRPKPKRVERSSDRHQAEKDMVRQPEDVRAGHGLAEDDMGESIDRYDFIPNYSLVPADLDLADAFGVPEGTTLLRREYIHRDRKTGALEAKSLSWLLKEVIDANPKIADLKEAAWPGGTMHQLYTVGIEIDEVVDHVTSTMPTTVEMEEWNLVEGTPLLLVRRISIDTNGRVVEVSDAQYPADRTMLTFRTPLKRWDDK
ncbi:GntR family transcriptional regulator [Amycolatopsis sp. NPDC054798]